MEKVPKPGTAEFFKKMKKAILKIIILSKFA
jgi:hypothetical protein